MVFKNWTKSRNYKRMRYVRRSRRKGQQLQRVYRPFEPTVQRFKEIVELNDIQLKGNQFNGGLLTFKLADLTNLSVYQNMFDFFRIVGVKLQLIPNYNSLDLTVTGANQLPTIFIAPYRDPWMLAPTNVTNTMELDGCKALRLTNPKKMYLRNPTPQLIYAGQGNVAPYVLSNPKLFWLGTGNNHTANGGDGTGFAHHGYQWSCDLTGYNLAIDLNVKVIATYYVKFKEQN